MTRKIYFIVKIREIEVFVSATAGERCGMTDGEYWDMLECGREIPESERERIKAVEAYKRMRGGERPTTFATILYEYRQKSKEAQR